MGCAREPISSADIAIFRQCPCISTGISTASPSKRGVSLWVWIRRIRFSGSDEARQRLSLNGPALQVPSEVLHRNRAHQAEVRVEGLVDDVGRALHREVDDHFFLFGALDVHLAASPGREAAGGLDRVHLTLRSWFEEMKVALEDERLHRRHMAMV